MSATTTISPVEAIKQLNQTLSVNDMGLPIGIYRADLLPYHLYDYNKSLFLKPGEHPHACPQELQGEEETPDSDIEPDTDYILSEDVDGTLEYLPSPIAKQSSSSSLNAPAPQTSYVAGFPSEELQQAFMPLDYSDGYPTFIGGNPFWYILEHEPPRAFSYFQAFLAMPLSGDRGDLPNDIGADISEHMQDENVRTIISFIAKQCRENPGSEAEHQALQQRLLDYYHTYYWNFRAKAFDLFKVAQNRKTNEMRAISLQDEHYVMFRRIRLQLAKYFENTEDFWDQLTPKVAIELLKTITQGERMSVGLAAMGPASSNQQLGVDNTTMGKSMEMIFRQAAIGLEHKDQIALTDAGAGADGRSLAESQAAKEFMQVIFDDPHALGTMQELIIKMNSNVPR